MDDTERCRVLDIYRGELERMRKAGSFVGNPKQEHPVAVLTRLCYDPDSKPELKFACAKEILPYCEAPKASQLRLEANGPGHDFNIQIIVPQWANGRADAANAHPAIDTTASRIDGAQD